MARKPLLSQRAIEIIADDRIRAAIEQGEFANLPGYGKPLALIDEPYEPNWWLKNWIRREAIADPKRPEDRDALRRVFDAS